MTDNGGARKAIFITGGGSGIGRATAQLFAQRGWFVGIADINSKGADETAAMLPAGQSATYRLDVRDRAQWQDALASFFAAAGDRLDVVFNNAGVGFGGRIGEFTAEHLDAVIDINLRGAIIGIQSALPFLKATPGSTILNTGSASGYYGSSGLSVYSASKFGIRAMTEALDIELTRDGIRVRDIMPSFIDTPLLTTPVPGSNHTARDRVMAAGLEFTPVETVAQAAWTAVHGEAVHTPVGKTARRLAFASRWTRPRLRAQLKRQFGGVGK